MNFIRALRAGFIAKVLLPILTIGAISGVAHYYNNRPVPAAPFVKIVVGQGHGSGVHIGNGFVLTAAHVITDKKDVAIQFDNGRSANAEVLWNNTTYDVALVRLPSSDGIAKAPLFCADRAVNSEVTAYGNPGQNDFVNMRGRIVSTPRQHGPWKAVVVTDMTTVPGMSGGAIVDEGGLVAGIVVGVAVQPIAFGASLVGVGYAVPASTICSLMGRK